MSQRDVPMTVAVCVEPGQMALEQRPRPELAGGEALVRISRIGVCGTDIHAFGGNQPYFDYPRVLGHELAGTVEAAVFAAQAYDAAFLLGLAIQQNGSAEREGVSEALRSVSSPPGEVILPGEWEKAVELIAAGTEINYEGASGTQDFDDNGDVPGVVQEMAVENGTFTGKGFVE